SANALLGTEEAPEEASGTEEAVSDAPEGAQNETAFDQFELEPEVPEDYASLAEEPDFDAQAQQEVEEVPEDQEFEYQDEESVALRRRALAAEKRAAWLEEQRIRQNEGTWKKEGVKFYPLSEPFVEAGLIKADSRRAYARECKRIHDAMKPFVKEKFLKPLEAALKVQQEEAVAEEVNEKKAQWGPPTAGGNAP